MGAAASVDDIRSLSVQELAGAATAWGAPSSVTNLITENQVDGPTILELDDETKTATTARTRRVSPIQSDVLSTRAQACPRHGIRSSTYRHTYHMRGSFIQARAGKRCTPLHVSATGGPMT